MNEIRLFDPAAQIERLQPGLDHAIARVLAHGRFILGPQVAELEQALAQRSERAHCITCANGTEALSLFLMAKGVGPGKTVFTPAFSFVAAAEAIALTGATPYFVDVDARTYNLDPASLEEGIIDARERGLDACGVVPVDLFGQPSDYRIVLPIARRHGLWVLADSAQSFGATLDGRPVVSWGEGATTSFFPSKPLGCFGDGGAVFVDDDALAEAIRSLRAHGGGRNKYDNVRLGLNSRLDTLQAAVLLQKLTIFDEERRTNRMLAERYREGLRGTVEAPETLDGAVPAWAMYTVISEERDSLRRELAEAGIHAAVYYPSALCDQPAYGGFPVPPSGVPVSRRLPNQVLSLPLHPYLTEAEQDRVIEAVVQANAKVGPVHAA